ncbi:MAG TPA: CU044_2847 family protein [Halomicronema sp.]
MSQQETILFKGDDGKIHELIVNITDIETVTVSEDEDSDYDEVRDVRTDAIMQMQKAQRMIRSYTGYVLTSFKNFSAGEIDEISLKFGMNLGGGVGLPYIVQGNADSNVEIQIKCKFPNKKSNGQT